MTIEKKGLTVFYLSCVLFVLSPVVAEAYSFTYSLRSGDRSSAVLELQKLLNKDQATRIAASGAGSSGQETDYFGALTRLAVIRFQEKYAAEILYPFGLSVGTGFVGQKTLQKLNVLAIAANPASTPAPSTSTVRPTGPAYSKVNNSIVPNISVSESRTNEVTGSSTVTSAATEPGLRPITNYGSIAGLPAGVEKNPNFEDYDTYMTDIRRAGRKQGYSDEKLGQVERAVYEAVSTTTNLRESFFKEDVAKRKVSEASKKDLYKGWRKFYLDTVNLLAEALYPKEAYAATCPGGVAFGSPRMFPVLLCTCSGNWLVAMQPVAPTYVALLTHYVGMQSYMNYSAPFGMSWIGCYTPGVQECMFVTMCGLAPCCIIIPSEGATTPFLGSA